MSLSRQEMLAEMGLSPRWVLRDGEALPVARRPAGGTTKAGANVAHSGLSIPYALWVASDSFVRSMASGAAICIR